MATIVFPAQPWAEGQEFAHGNVTLKFTNGRWKQLVPPSGGGGGGGGLSEIEVGALIDGRLETLNVNGLINDAIGELNVNGAIDTKIQALNLGSLATADMFISTAAPDNGIGKNGDLWAQTT